MLIERIAVMGLMPAAEAAGTSTRTARKWRDRFEQDGVAGLLDRSSRPVRTRSTADAELAKRIEQLRRARMPMRRIAALVGRSVATVSRLLAGMGLSSLKALEPKAPVVRYERQAPGELLHMDTKKLTRIVRPSHRVTGDRRDSVDGAGWEFAHVAIDDHSRCGFVQMHKDERKESAVQALKAAVAHYDALGVKVKRLPTDNGSAYRSKLFARTCQALGIKHTFIKPYRPQTNGKAERFIQTCLREWAYGRTWANSARVRHAYAALVEEGRWARYRHVQPLANAKSDAQAIAASLGRLGFVVTLRTDLDERTFKEVLRTFRADIQGGDEVVVYFLGAWPVHSAAHAVVMPSRESWRRRIDVARQV